MPELVSTPPWQTYPGEPFATSFAPREPLANTFGEGWLLQIQEVSPASPFWDVQRNPQKCESLGFRLIPALHRYPALQGPRPTQNIPEPIVSE